MNRFNYPRIFERSNQFEVFVDDVQVDVIHSCVADICIVISDKPVDVKVNYREEIREQATSISPTAAGKEFSVDGKSLFCKANPDEKFVVFINNRYSMCPLFIAVYSPEEKPDVGDPNVLFFKSGQVYEAGEIILQDNQTLYIEEGAIVRGCVRAYNADNIKICGRGVLDNSYYDYENNRVRTVRLDTCSNVEIRDIAIINATAWMVELDWCDNVLVDGIIESGKVVSSDGIDIVASSNVTVRNCLLSNNDDCVVIKAFHSNDEHKNMPVKDVENVLVEKCILLNGPAGNGIEIGHELHSEYIKDIVFRDCDIVTCHDSGSALSIHNCDDATVKDILFEDIRIEHYFDKLFDIRVMRSQFGHKAPGLGHINGVKLKNIKVKALPCNTGYSVALVSGFDKEHLTQNVTFEDIYINDDVIINPELIEMCFRNVQNIQFIDTANNRKNVINYNE